MIRTIVLAGALLALVLAPFSSTQAQSPTELRRMLLTLEETVVTVDFKQKPLPEVLRFFSDFTGVNLVVSPRLFDERDEVELEVTLSLRKVSVKTALGIILDLKQLGLVYRYGVLMVTTPQDARGKPVLRIYSIADLTVPIRDFPAPDLMLRPAGTEDFGNIFTREEEGAEHAFADPETILDLVSENTGKDTWEDEGVRISVTSRHLIVRTYPSVHREIANLLNLLRAFR
jgi:hypothetical protein